jgi:Zn-dependent protease with chaperone function
MVGVWLCGSCAPSAKLPALSPDDIAAERRRQEIAQLRDYYEQLHRVDTVGFRIAVANRDDCKDWISAQIGLHAVTPQSLPRKYRSFSAEALNLTWARATVISVVDGSPAAVIGIKNGDELVTFNNEPVPATGTPAWIGRFLKHNGERPVTIVLRRDGLDQTVTVNPVLACAIPIDFETNQEANAFTDYKKIVIQSGFLRSLRTDADLATIVGHELAHVTMGHYKKRLINEAAGALGGALIDGGFLLGGIYTGRTFSDYLGQAGRRVFSVSFELEADYVGAYYAARAGYDISGAEEVWRAMAREYPNDIRKATTHPTSPVRFLQMKKVVEEIADKKRRNLPLVPELQAVQVQTEPAPERETVY